MAHPRLSRSVECRLTYSAENQRLGRVSAALRRLVFYWDGKNLEVACHRHGLGRHEPIIMKTTLLSTLSAIAIGLCALAPTTASARPFCHPVFHGTRCFHHVAVGCRRVYVHGATAGTARLLWHPSGRGGSHGGDDPGLPDPGDFEASDRHGRRQYRGLLPARPAAPEETFGTMPRWRQMAFPPLPRFARAVPIATRKTAGILSTSTSQTPSSSPAPVSMGFPSCRGNKSPAISALCPFLIRGGPGILPISPGPDSIRSPLQIGPLVRDCPGFSTTIWIPFPFYLARTGPARSPSPQPSLRPTATSIHAKFPSRFPCRTGTTGCRASIRWMLGENILRTAPSPGCMRMKTKKETPPSLTIGRKRAASSSPRASRLNRSAGLLSGRTVLRGRIVAAR